MSDTLRIEHWPDTMQFAGRSWVPRHETEARLRALREELEPLRALAVEAKKACPDVEDGTVAIGPAIRITRELAALAPKGGTDGVA